jgi:hypothetical protein
MRGASMILEMLKRFTTRLEFRSLAAKKRWQSFRDLVLLVLNNSDTDRRPPPRRPAIRE